MSIAAHHGKVRLEWMAGIAGILGIFSFSSIVLNVYRTGDTNALTWTWLFLNTIGQAMYLIYSWVNGLYGIFYPCLLFVLGLVYITLVKAGHTQSMSLKEREKLPVDGAA